MIPSAKSISEKNIGIAVDNTITAHIEDKMNVRSLRPLPEVLTASGSLTILYLSTDIIKCVIAELICVPIVINPNILHTIPPLHCLSNKL